MTTSPGAGGSRSSSSRDPPRGAQPCDPVLVGTIAHCCDSKLEGRRCRTQHPRSAELRVRCRGRLRVSMRLRLDTLAPGSNELVNVDVPNHWLSISRQGVASHQHSHEYHMNLNIAHDATEPGRTRPTKSVSGGAPGLNRRRTHLRVQCRARSGPRLGPLQTLQAEGRRCVSCGFLWFAGFVSTP